MAESSLAIPPLYIWFDTEPGVMSPDYEIPDIPGIADIELLYAAILEGRLGTMLPSKIAISPNENPQPSKVRSIDVGRLLRERGVRHRRCYELQIAFADQGIFPGSE